MKGLVCDNRFEGSSVRCYSYMFQEKYLDENVDT